MVPISRVPFCLSKGFYFSLWRSSYSTGCTAAAAGRPPSRWNLWPRPVKCRLILQRYSTVSRSLFSYWKGRELLACLSKEGTQAFRYITESVPRHPASFPLFGESPSLRPPERGRHQSRTSRVLTASHTLSLQFLFYFYCLKLHTCPRSTQQT